MPAGISVYCAGPLFNRKEQEEMHELAEALEKAGFDTFLPQRDGLELSKCARDLADLGYSPEDAHRVMSEAIFALDVYQVLHRCGALVANLNGRVPDEGTVSEVAMAWSRGKTVIGYKADSRSAFSGQDNPLVAGLFGFQLCQSPQEVVASLEEQLAGAARQSWVREEEISDHTELGSKIWAVIQNGMDVKQLAAIVKVRSHSADMIT